jgi:hypothetical protein
MHSRENLITYLCLQQEKALEEALSIGDPDPQRWAMEAVLQELEQQFSLRLPQPA